MKAIKCYNKTNEILLISILPNRNNHKPLKKNTTPFKIKKIKTSLNKRITILHKFSCLFYATNLVSIDKAQSFRSGFDALYLRVGKNPGNLKKPMGMGKLVFTGKNGKNGKSGLFSKHMFKKHFKSLANK